MASEKRTKKDNREKEKDYMYQSFEEWERMNFPRLSYEKEVGIEKTMNLDVSDEMLQKLKDDYFDFVT